MHFIPYVTITPTPDTGITQAQCSSNAECIGYSTLNGKGFTAKIFSKGGSQLTSGTDPKQGTYFKSLDVYKAACDYIKGSYATATNTCSVTASGVKTSIDALAKSGSVVEKFVSDDNTFAVQFIKVILLIAFLVCIIKLVNSVGKRKIRR